MTTQGGTATKQEGRPSTLKEPQLLPTLLTVICIVFGLFLMLLLLSRAGKDKRFNKYGDYIVLKTPTGRVVGQVLRGVLKETDHVFYFQSIPYAEPPIGQHRFTFPVLKPQWEDVYNGSQRFDRCAQLDYDHYYMDDPEMYTYNEDCLTLDIYAPADVIEEVGVSDRNVIVLLHGGSFQYGSKHEVLYDARTLCHLTRSVIVVPNYRLNILGFAYTNGSGPPGNMGLWDQTLALNWIQKNIGSFGGDIQNLTMWGIDAGAVSAGLHVFSPSTSFYIDRLIMQGGSPFFIGIYSYAGVQQIYDVARTLCNKSKEFPMSCMRSVPIHNLMSLLPDFNGLHSPMFGPRLKGDDEFLFVNVDEARYNLKLLPPLNETYAERDILIGYTENEGEFFLRDIMTKWKIEDIGALPRNAQRLFVERLILKFFRPQRLDRIFDYYFGESCLGKPEGEGSSGEDIYLQAARFVGDVMVKCPVKLFADFMSQSGANVYVYEFSYALDKLSKMRWLAATHYSDALMATGSPYRLRNADATDRNYSHRIMSKFAHFCETGTPTREGDLAWPRYSIPEPKVARISFSRLQVRLFSGINECAFLLESSRMREESVQYDPPRSSASYTQRSKYAKPREEQPTTEDHLRHQMEIIRSLHLPKENTATTVL